MILGDDAQSQLLGFPWGRTSQGQPLLLSLSPFSSHSIVQRQRYIYVTNEPEKKLIIFTHCCWDFFLHAVSFKGTTNLKKLWVISAWSVTRWINLILENSTNKSTVAIELSRAPQSVLPAMKLAFRPPFVYFLGQSLHYFYICQENKVLY